MSSAACSHTSWCTPSTSRGPGWIRAWNLSGECDLWTKWFSFLGEDMINRKQRCVREGAIASLMDNENCPDIYVARAAIEEAWAPCWHDYWPFNTRPDLDTRWRENPMLS